MSFKNSGMVSVFALMTLVVFASLSLAYATVGDLNVQQSATSLDAFNARLAAEGGLEFILNQMWSIRIRQHDDTTSMATAIRDSLGAKLNDTFNLGGSSVTSSGNVVSVPSITVDGQSFACTITCLNTSTVRLKVRGGYRNLQRSLQIDMAASVRRSAAFDYGLACKGPISIAGNARFIGVNRPLEASVLSATQTAAQAITVDGSVYLSGDLSVSGTSSSILIKGNPTIGDTANPSLWGSHCHFGVEAPDFPEYDTAALSYLATNIIDKTTALAAKTTLQNVRIKAGTNPTFNNHMTINGIVFVESPNVVKFEGQAAVNGMIVTQQGTSSSDCKLSFAGGVQAYGVEALPDTADFAAVKAKKGTFILAPGYAVSFAGTVDAVNGNIAADNLTFTGTAQGTIRGSMIGLTDTLTSINGTVDIYVDRDNAEENPAGFVKVYALACDPSSYSEIIE